MAVRRLQYNWNTTLDGSGNGSVRILPSVNDWKIETLSVKTSTRTLEPTASIYLNVINDGNFIEASASGGGDTSDTVHMLSRGESLYVVWAGGDPGATATVSVMGWETTFDDTRGINALR